MNQQRFFYHDDAEEYAETVVCSDRDKRHIHQRVKENGQRLANIMSEQYQSSVKQIEGDLESVTRICDSGSDAVDSILEDLRNGNLTAAEAAKELGAARRDLNKIRQLANDAETVEEHAWASVDMTPGEFERGVAERFPALFQGGRSLLALPTYDD